MAYEIPQQLQHKEKIIFGLTFPQIVWAGLFSFILLIIFRLPIPLWTRFIVAVLPASIGILFVFFDFYKWVTYFKSFLTFRTATLNSLNMKSLLEIKKVEDDIVKSHTDIAILQITPINFSIKTKDEKNTIIWGFQKFLNGLDFPVQFVVTTNSLNIDNYLEALKERVTDEELFDDFATFMKSTIEKNQMRNRSFYLVIPKHSDLEIQCRLCKERLESIGLKSIRLTDKQILNNLHLFFNDIGDKRSDEEFIRDGLHYIITPNLIKDNVKSFMLNNKHCRIISAIGYPRTVESGFLDKIISSNDDFDISIHMEPFPIETMMLMLNREIQKQRADLYAEQKKNSINPSLEIKFQDTLKVLENLQKGNEKLFNVSLYINCKAKSSEELDLLTKKVEAELNSLMIIPKVPIFRQIQGYKSLMPIAKDSLKIKRNITTQALSAFFPFTSPFLTLENKGVMLGLNKNKVPFIKDIFSLSNANGIVLATSGSGKSYFTKLLISRQLLNNTQVLIVDPQSEYIGLMGHCKGELVTISRTSKTIINPLDLMGHDFIEKRLALMDMFKIMFRDLSEVQKAILDKAISYTYAKKKITANSYKNKRPPILGDLYKVLISMEKKASQMEKVTYRALINRMYMYTKGVFSFLNRQTSIKFNNRMVCFNIGDMPKQVKPLVMFLILDFVYMRMKESKERKLLIIDEAWSLLGHAEEASYIFEIVKTCRKFNMGLLLITQDVADLINSKAGHAVLANSSYSLLLRQKPSVIESVVKTFHLSQMEKEYLLTATQGRGILIMDNDHQELEVVASPKEHQIITTNADEILEQKEKKKEVKEIKRDLDQVLYYGTGLSKEQKNTLYNNGYKTRNFVPIGKPRQEEVWIKENDVESLDHTFLVENLKEEILKLTSDVKTYVTKKPDIIFKNKKGQEIAIEVETGKSFRKHKKRLIEKFREVHLKYKNRVAIIITQKSLKDRYTRIAPYLKILKRTEIMNWIKQQFR
jgi:conjugal transfer ATP-binding protein TraC